MGEDCAQLCDHNTLVATAMRLKEISELDEGCESFLALLQTGHPHNSVSQHLVGDEVTPSLSVDDGCSRGLGPCIDHYIYGSGGKLVTRTFWMTRFRRLILLPMAMRIWLIHWQARTWCSLWSEET